MVALTKSKRGGGVAGKKGAAFKIDPTTEKGKNIRLVIKRMATGENAKDSKVIAAYLNEKYPGLDVTSRTINTIRNELGIPKFKAGQLKTELWDNARWERWQREKLSLLEKPGWKAKFDNALPAEQQRWRDAIKNRNMGESEKAVKNINAQWGRKSRAGRGRGKKAPEFKDWNSLLRYATKQAGRGFRRHMTDVGPRAINMLADSAEANYVYNLFLKAQIEHLATGNPLQQVSHADAARGAKSTGLSGGFNYFLEDATENQRRSKLNLPPEDTKGWKSFQDAQRRYSGYTGQNVMPMTQNEVLGDLRLGKWGNQSVPWQTYGDESRKHLLMRARQAGYEQSQKLRPIDKAKQMIPSGLMKFGKFGLRFLPFAGAAFSADAAVRHQQAGNPNLATLAAISASPNPLISWPALLGEWGGSFLNRETGRERFPEGQQGWRQSLLDPNHPGLGGG